MLQLKLAEKEKVAEAAAACGKHPAVWAREKILSGRFPATRPPQFDLLMYTELKKIGVNLNQLTRLANTGIIDRSLLGLILKLLGRIDYLIIKIVHDSRSKNR
jgi:uncharacterized protein YbjT (DUF2867 family)